VLLAVFINDLEILGAYRVENYLARDEEFCLMLLRINDVNIFVFIMVVFLILI